MTSSPTDIDTHDPLIQRLAALNPPVPESLIPRVLAATPRKRANRVRPHRLGAGLVAATALLVANLVAGYLSPRYAQALADVPLAGNLTAPLLAQAGLTEATAFDQSSTVGSYTVRLFGGYADSVRTTLFVEVLDANGAPAPDGTYPVQATLTDQFGHVYQQAHVGGAPVMNFEPLVWPASSLGARLSLHIGSIVVPVPTSVQGSATAAGGVSGPWDLGFALADNGGGHLPVPAPVSVSGTTYTVTDVEYTRSLLDIRWTISGAAVREQDRLAHDHQVASQSQSTRPTPGHAVPVPLPAGDDAAMHDVFEAMNTVSVHGPDGAAIEPVYGYGSADMRDGHEQAFTMESWTPLHGAGTYTFVARDGAPGRDIAVP